MFDDAWTQKGGRCSEKGAGQGRNRLFCRRPTTFITKMCIRRKPCVMAWMAKKRASTFHNSLTNFASEMDQVAANWLRGQLYVGQVRQESWTMPRNLQVLAPPQNASTNHDSLPACAFAPYASAPVALTRENSSAKSFAQVVRGNCAHRRTARNTPLQPSVL
jgi:hypothetical protein